MKKRLSFAFGALSLGLVPMAHGVDIPEDIPGDPGSGRDPGFIIRTVQAFESEPPPNGSPLPATLNRGIFQLNGTLRDEFGVLLENEAMPGTNADGTFSVPVINFEKDALEEDVNGNPEEGGGPVTNFQPNALFPGIPGTEGHTTNFAMEVVTYLELTAGEHTFGGQVWRERTDTGGDDFFAVSTGTNPRDFLSLEVAEYEKILAEGESAFLSTPNDYTYTVTAPVDGLYPFRLVFVQDVRGASLEWYSVDSATGDKILLNDPEDPRAIKAFQRSTATHHNHPYIGEIRPQPGNSGVPASEKIEFLLLDDGSNVDQGTLQVFHNDVEITGDADITSADGRTSVSYQPNPTRLDLGNVVRVVFQDTAGRSFEQTWDFEISAGEGVTRVTGQWDFNGDLSASAGQDMAFLSDEAESRTEFGTTTSFGIPDINGEVAEVMLVPDAEGREPDIGYIMYHGLSANGGGSRVNQYTLIMDAMIAPDSSGAAGIIQIDSPRPGGNGEIRNSGDADFFWQNGAIGQGGGGYHGSAPAGEWHRIVFAVDLAADPPVVTKFINGEKIVDWAQNGTDQPRRALLDEYSILFTDGDDGEQLGWYVNSVQIRDGKMSDVEVQLLGGPTAEGIPLALFDDPNATVSTRNVFGDLGNDFDVQTGRITVYNSGETQDLTIDSVTVTGPESEFYRVVSFPGTLASAEEGAIVVEFDPQGESGVFEAALEVVSNDGGDAVISIDVSARLANANGLVAHYPMDETEGTTMLDASGQRYHGMYGAAGTGSFSLDQDGLASGRAVRFSDGGSPAADGGGFGQLDATASIPSLQNLTISMWIQPDPADAGASMLLAKGTLPGDPFALATNAIGDENPLLWFVQEAEEIITDPVMTVGETHHVVITQLDENGLELGSTRTRLYLDGELIAEVLEGNGYEDLKPSVIQIGALNGGFGFTGLVDDVQIYSRELAEDEVQFLFENPGAPVESPAQSTEFYPIAAVSSSTVNFYAVENLIQGPGVGFANEGPNYVRLVGGPDGAWVTDAPGGFPADYVEVAGPPVITLDLGSDVPLGEISVWGYSADNANGVSAFSLRFASDAEGEAGFGSSIAYNPSFEPANDDTNRQSFRFDEVLVARYVEFTADDNFFEAPGDGSGGEIPGGDRVGLGEIAFEVSSLPPLEDVTDPLDNVIIVNGENDEDGNAGGPPNTEGVANVINNVTQKYLNFLDLGSGFIVTPRVGPTIVTGLRLFTANDAVERDPASFQLMGSVTGPRADDFELIAEGPLALPDERNEGGNIAIDLSLAHQELLFANDKAYVSYQLIFPTLKDAETANSMQIAEVELLGTVAPEQETPLSEGLVAYYPLDGHTLDAVGDSHGVGKTWVAGGKQDQPELLADHPSAELTFTDGAFGQGVDLDGAGQYIETPLENEERFDFGAPDNPTGFTVSAWFRVDGFTKGWQALVAKGEQNQWRLHRQGETDNLVGNGGNADIGQNLESVNDGQLHHIALVSDPAAGNVRLYVDGVLREEGAAPALENNPMPMMIGQNPDTDDRTWDGLIDDVAFWSRPLSTAEVERIAGSDASLGELADIPPVIVDPPTFDLLDVSLGADGAFSATLPEGVTADVEYSLDLLNWEVIFPGASGQFEDTDAARLAEPQGYYRARP